MSSTIVQVEMTDLDVTISVGVHQDPGGDFEERNAAPRPPVAPVTAGPHRFTVHVPHDDAATFSIGQGCPERIKDTGITGRTNTHIHFETRETAKTIVSLGGPTQDSMIFSYDEPVLGGSNGFAMVTEEVAWMESGKKFHVTSQGEDVVLRALQADKRVVVQADHGYVDLIAGHDVNAVGKSVKITSAIEPHLADVNYEGAWTSQVPDTHDAEGWTHTLEIVACLSVAADLAIEAINFVGHHRYKGGTNSPYVKPAMTAGHWMATLARIGLTTAHMLHLKDHPHPPGVVKISAASDFGVVAGGTANVFGKTGATLGSAMFSTVLAPLATLEGVLFAGVAGKHSAVLGLMGVEIGAPLGTTYIEAKKEVEIDSHGEIIIGGHKDVFIRSGHHGAFVHGHTTGYVGAGVGAGWGLLAKGDELKLGKLSSAEDFGAVAVEDESMLWFKDGMIVLQNGKAGVAVANDKVTVSSDNKAGELVIEGNEVKVDGARVLIC